MRGQQLQLGVSLSRLLTLSRLSGLLTLSGLPPFIF